MFSKNMQESEWLITHTKEPRKEETGKKCEKLGARDNFYWTFEKRQWLQQALRSAVDYGRCEK